MDEKEDIEIYSDVVHESKSEQSEAEQKLVNKINWRVGPFVFLILFIQYVDKSTLSIVSVLPQFYKDTGISENQYGWLGSFFYLGYLCMQLPNNYMLQKVAISKYVGVALVLWGASLIGFAFAHSFAQLAALRAVLGFLEAITYPAMFLLIATLFRRSEQVIWFGIMFMSNDLAGIVGFLTGVGIIQMPNVGNISPWKWAFIIYGAITCFFGFFYFFFLPDKPTSKWFGLTEEEKLIVEDRVRDNAVVPTLKVNKDQIWEALKEPRFYCYALISMFVNFQNSALGIFGSIIIAELGFSSTDAILLNIPTAIMTMLLIFISTNVSKKTGEIIWIAMITCTISLIGMICLAAIPSGGVKLIGIYLSAGGTATFVLLQASITSNVSGYTKKIFYNSVNIVFYTLGNFVGPLLLLEQDAPRYLLGWGVYIAANALIIVLFAYVRYSYVQANKKRHLDKNVNSVALPDDLEDITDGQNQHFVYRT